MICKSDNPAAIDRVLRGESVGTVFLPHKEAAKGRKRWLLALPVRVRTKCPPARAAHAAAPARRRPASPGLEAAAHMEEESAGPGGPRRGSCGWTAARRRLCRTASRCFRRA